MRNAHLETRFIPTPATLCFGTRVGFSLAYLARKFLSIDATSAGQLSANGSCLRSAHFSTGHALTEAESTTRCFYPTTSFTTFIYSFL